MTYGGGPAPASRAPVNKGGASNLADVLNAILDKGIVIDAWARVSIIGIEILTIEARVVVASVETYLRYAEAIGLTALASKPQEQAVSGRQGSVKEVPSGDDVVGYLSAHPDGARLGELAAFFNAPRRELEDVLNDLVEENKVNRDEEQKLYFSASQELPAGTQQ